MAQIVYVPQALSDLDRVEEFAPGAVELIMRAVAALEDHPFLGRTVDPLLHELIISRGKTGYVALYRYLEDRDLVRVLRVRHQREVWRQT